MKILHYSGCLPPKYAVSNHIDITFYELTPTRFFMCIADQSATGVFSTPLIFPECLSADLMVGLQKQSWNCNRKVWSMVRKQKNLFCCWSLGRLFVMGSGRNYDFKMMKTLLEQTCWGKNAPRLFMSDILFNKLYRNLILRLLPFKFTFPERLVSDKLTLPTL